MPELGFDSCCINLEENKTGKPGQRTPGWAGWQGLPPTGTHNGIKHFTHTPMPVQCPPNDLNILFRKNNPHQGVEM